LISSVAKPTEIYTEQAQLNEKPATNAAQSGDNDWAVTICFYSAIHYVKAYAVISKKTFINFTLIKTNQIQNMSGSWIMFTILVTTTIMIGVYHLLHTKHFFMQA